MYDESNDKSMSEFLLGIVAFSFDEDLSSSENDLGQKDKGALLCVSQKKKLQFFKRINDRYSLDKVT